MQKATQVVSDVVNRQQPHAGQIQKGWLFRPDFQIWWAFGGALILLSAVFWDAILVLVQRWWHDPDYHHGFLVPLFALYLLWRRKGRLANFDPSSSVTTSAMITGMISLVLAGLVRAGAVLYYVRIADPAAIIPAFFGIVLCLFGWKGLRWAWPAGIFLVFMLPMPGAVATLLSHPLQRAGTIASTFLIQMLGIPAIAEGNMITLREGQLEVVRACSGLKMMSLFFAVCFGAAFLSERPWVDRLVMIFSAPVVALVANILRITATALLVEWNLMSASLDHELAGWLMMPTAVLLLYGELAIWDRLFVPIPEGPQRITLTQEKPAGANARGEAKEARS